MKSSSKTIYSCQNCGHQTPKWMGKCPDCGSWDSFAEEAIAAKTDKGKGAAYGHISSEPVPIDSVPDDVEERTMTGISEFDRVLGGGMVVGSLVLIGGDPGIGKSTLMLQALHKFAEKGMKSLYISGEESIRQLMLRSKRLGAASKNLLAASEINIDSIIAMAETKKPGVVVIDSIQTMYNSDLSSAPGSVSQVRESTMRLMVFAKKTGIPIFLVGHVTKDGAIAGPRVMEHMVDTVLYFEGDRNYIYRILRAVKNRFGSTNEIGVFEMKDLGLVEVPNPSAVFLSERPDNAPGSTVTACMEGTRPVLVELQALVGSTSLGTPRRTILGLDKNRVALLSAVMEKKLGMQLMGMDIFMKVAGGVKVDEPAVDLGIICSIASSFLDVPVPEGTLMIGEVGLTGEIRAVGQVENRISEAAKMGFTRCIVPTGNIKRLSKNKKIEIHGVDSVKEAIDRLF